MKFGFDTTKVALVGAGAVAAVLTAAPIAAADPVAPPAPLPGPASPGGATLTAPVASDITIAAPGTPLTAPVASDITIAAPGTPLTAPVAPEAAPLATPVATDVATAALADPTEAFADGVPHLMSPENLPPGTSTIPQTQSRLSYVRDLWHAMQTQEVSGSDALLLLTQRPLSANPAPGMPAGPQQAPPARADQPGTH